MTAASRVLIAELDSPAQHDRFATREARDAIAELSGMLRIGMLISGDVLVTDAMILDGSYFITLGPEGILRELGASSSRYPLVITGPHDSLRAGLDARRADEGFRWSLPQIDDARQVSVDVSRAWDDWIRLTEQGVIRYEKQSGMQTPVRLGELPQHLVGIREQILDSGVASIRRRSEAFAVIEGRPWSEDTKAAVRRWWNDAYLRMIAENASADWVSFESEASHAPLARSGDAEIPLSAGLVGWARRSTAATIAVAWDTTGTQRAALHRRPTAGRMRNLAFAATQTTSAPSRPGVLAGSSLKLVAAFAVIVLALPFFDIGSAANPWTWVAFAGAIATTVPFDSLRALLGLLEPDPLVRLVLHRGGA